MCGVTGFHGRGTAADLEAMTDAVFHRGPDGGGYHVDPDARIHLGHRRLAILDIKGGEQPMWNEDSTVAVVFNGEIYNHAELRQELERKGHRFRSAHSDTEVLVHGYEEWGADLPARLNGMFAFAIWDKNRKRLFFARDRFGEKPLFYSDSPGCFIFASELPALVRHPEFDATLDSHSLQKFFAYGFFPAPCTPYKHARKLPGGHSLTFDLQTGHTQIAAYWRFALQPETSWLDRNEDELAEELGALFDQAVKRRLISDVPLGVFLSGGLDSSAVLAAATRANGTDAVDTFSIGFNEPSFDESNYAQIMADAFGSRHHVRKLGIDQARDIIPRLLTTIGEPLGDPSILPTFLLSQFTREKVTVALSGDGGDELFAGYDPFRALRPASIYHRLVPPPIHRLLSKLAEGLPISAKNMSIDFKIRRALRGLSHPPEMWNPVWLGPYSPAEIREIFASPSDTGLIYEEAISLWNEAPSRSYVDKTMEFYTNYYLQDGILTKVDRASMLNSLETRAVFLDNDLVAFCQKLPESLKYRKGKSKYLLRKAFAKRLPERILTRPKKGFGIPLASWLRDFPANVPMGPVADMDSAKMATAWSEHRAGKADHRLALWSWLSLQGFNSPELMSARALG
jgi:asparagine synthase (glutamine-hydrolysing)